MKVLQHREAQYHATKNMQTQPAAPIGGTTQAPDISTLLQILNAQQQPQQTHQYQPLHPPQTTQSATSGLEAIFAQFANNNVPAAQTSAPPQHRTLDPNLAAALGAGNWQSQSHAGYVQPPASQPDLVQSLLAQIVQQPNAQQQNYGYQPAYQNENERKRHYDHDHESRRNNESYSDKRAKGNTGKKVSLSYL